MWDKIKDIFNKENISFFLNAYSHTISLFILGILIFRDNNSALAGYLIGIPTGYIVSEIINLLDKD